jgi:4-hydroxy-tetrahydrodipicolinate synthase
MKTQSTQKRFNGAYTALVTPFALNSQIDWAALHCQVERQIESGIRGLVPCGTTGESPTLSHDEHDEVIRSVVKKANGRVPVLAGTGSNNTAEAVRLTQAAKQSGADGALVVAPYYNKPSQDGIMNYYRAVAKVGLPVVLYDIPGRCGGQGVSAQTILALAHEGVIVGLKWASGNFDQLQDVLAGRPEGFNVFSGDDNLTFPAMCLGADGVVSVAANLVPKHIVDLVTDLALAMMMVGRARHFYLLPLMRAMFLETNPVPVKTALAMAWPGVFQEAFRSPLCRMSPENREKLWGVLRSYGLVSEPTHT